MPLAGVGFYFGPMAMTGITTAEIMATVVDAARVGVVNVMTADEREPSELGFERAVEVVGHYVGPTYGPVQLEHDLVQLKDLDLVATLATGLEFFTEAGKIQLLRATLFVAIADGSIDAVPYAAAAEFGLALGLAPDHVRSIMQRFLDDHMPTIELD